MPPKRLRENFRLNAKKLFLTWPRCHKTTQEVLEAAVSKFSIDNIKYICVAREEHEDGTPHIHLALVLNTRCDIKSTEYLDELVGQHGNYQTARNIKDVVEYIKKDGNFIEKGELPNKNKISLVVAQTLQNGGTLDDIDELDAGFLLMHLTAIQKYQSFQIVKKIRKIKPPPPLLISRWRFHFEIGFPLIFKQRQYWIHGPPNTGKTTFIRELEEMGFRAFLIPTNNNFEGYDDAAYDFTYIDEFKGQLTIQFLNEWLQGSKMKLNTKYGAAFKNSNLPCFILSNFSPENCYKNQDSENIAPLMTRLHVINTA